MDAQRLEWVAGRIESLRLGGYGYVVHLRATASGVIVQTVTPRKQETLRPNSRAVRELALRVADTIIARRNGGTRAAKRRRPRLGVHGILTPRDIWLALLSSKLQPLPQDILDWGRSELVEHYRKLDAESRAALPSVDTINNILTAARALDRRGVIPLDCDFDALEAGAITGKLQAWVLEGYSAETVATYWRRFRWAVLEFQRLWPRRWSKRTDETAAVRIPKRHRGRKPREMGEDRMVALLSQLLNDGEWRAAAALMVARASGRRIGAIAGHRPGLHLDAPPLTAADFTRDTNGRLLVRWRAEVAKGGGYGRGDEVQVAPRELAVVYRWLTRYHPNPLGPTYPLIWDADDPAVAASYDSLTSALSAAWQRAFGEPKPRGVAWHAVIRTTVTTIAEEEGVVPAAVHTGREVETVERHYFVPRPAHQEEAVAVLDSRRRSVRQRRAVQ